MANRPETAKSISMREYQPTIGLEIHAILKTRTKMFCDSLNDPEEKEPNKNTCPVCLGHPGTLPVINKQALECVVRVGLALGGEIAKESKFDRKNYFYPDLPKGYQISQYDQPLVAGGELLGVRVRRVHLEEDAGRLLHEIPGDLPAGKQGSKKGEASYVDFNRAGVPLMELVTEPDVRSAEQATEFAKELRRILRYLGVSDADMEKGQMRVEANVSLDMGPKVELKNINSFKAVESAIAYEVKRQREVLELGGEVEHETRGWDEAGQKTVSQRSKEEAHDYRYFPEPDLPLFEPAKIFDLTALRSELPEMPAQKRERFSREFGLNGEQAAFLADDKRLADFFEAAVSELGAMNEPHEKSEKQPAHLLYNYLTSDLLGLLSQRGIAFAQVKVKPEQMAHLVDLIRDGKIGSRQAKDILAKMTESGEDPETIMKSGGLETVSDEAIVSAIIQEVMTENLKAAEDYKKGKEASLQFLVGQAMRKLKGRGNPEELKRLFKESLT